MDAKTTYARMWDRKQIKFPGIYAGMPIDDYHKGNVCVEPSVSSGILRMMFLKSPAHAWDQCRLNPKRDDSDDDKEAFTVGRAAHHLLFGEKEFQQVFCLRPDRLYAGRFKSEGREWEKGGSQTAEWKEWVANREAEGRAILSSKQMDSIRGMAMALASHPLVQAGALNGAIERSWFWRDEETGLWLKVRPDATPNDSLDFVDLKTTQSVALRDIRRSIEDYGYYQQAALVDEACRNILGQPMQSFTLMFIEKKRPYCVEAVTLVDGDVHRGRRANRYALRTFAKCLKTRHWPGPNGDRADAAYIGMSEWAQNNIDERLKLLTGE